MVNPDDQAGPTEPRKDRRDVRETLVEKSLFVFPHEEITQIISAFPGKQLDAEGVDMLIILSTGVAVPIQIKSGQQTIGVVLPLPEEREKWPKRLAIVSHRMASKLSRHFRKHPSVKCFLFVNRPRGFDDKTLQDLFNRAKKNPSEPWPEQVILAMKEISEEVRHLILFVTKNTCFNLFYPKKK